MRQSLIFLAFGALFGFILSRVGATDYDAIVGMFALTDLHLMGVIGSAVLVAGVGLRLLRRRRPTLAALASMTPKPRKAGNVVGGLLFGAGWAITGTCPGTVMAQLGEGKMVALFTLTGILIGAALYQRLGHGVERALTPAPRDDAAHQHV